MKLTTSLLICCVVLPVIAQRIDHPTCPDGFKYVFVNSNLEWVGLGWAWTTYSHLLNNMTLEVDFATAELANTTFLGSLKIIRFHLINNLDEIKTWNIVFEIKFPIQEPVPDVIEIILNGETLCYDPESLDTKRKPDMVQLQVQYNDYTKEQKFTSKLIKRKDRIPFPLSEDTINIDTIGCGKVALSKIDIPFALDGAPIPRGTWPWLVSVYSHFDQRLQFRCGATLISNKLVVTAAHCFFDIYDDIIEYDDVLLILGQYDLKKIHDADSKIVFPESVNIHPNYGKRSKVDSDIAVVVLPKAIPFTTYILPACLWKESDSESIVDLIGLSAAWGQDEDQNLIRQLPEQVEIPVVSNETCSNSQIPFSKISSDLNFCAGWQNATDGPCSGDSGGPLLFERDGRWTLRGVLSKSLSPSRRNTCNNNKFIVFTDVAKFRNWILSFERSD